MLYIPLKFQYHIGNDMAHMCLSKAILAKTGYTLEQPQAVGIFRIVGISLMNKGPAIENLDGLNFIHLMRKYISKIRMS